MIQDQAGRGPDLLGKILGGGAMPGGVGRIAPADLLLRKAQRDDLLDQRKAQPLLQRADHQQIGQMDPVIALFHRLRHDLGADIVVDGRRRYQILLLLQLRRKIIQIMLQQEDDLLHIKADVWDLLPGGETVSVQIGFPAAKLARHQPLIIIHSVCILSCNIRC